MFGFMVPNEVEDEAILEYDGEKIWEAFAEALVKMPHYWNGFGGGPWLWFMLDPYKRCISSFNLLE